jgi:aminopeptidase N/puromycin-sensitive aminopeptidase
VVRREFGEVYATLAGKGKHESYQHAELRGMMFEDLGRANDPAVLAQAEILTKQVLAGQRPADPGILDAAVALATAKGDVSTYESLLRVSRNATDPDLKEAALHALTRFQTPPLVTRTLEYAVSDEVRSQDSWAMIASLLDQRETQDQAWEFVEARWEAIERKSTAGSGARIIEAAGAFCSVEKRDQVESFFRAHPVESAQTALAKSIDSIEGCAHFRKAEEPELRIWLDKQTPR